MTTIFQSGSVFTCELCGASITRHTARVLDLTGDNGVHAFHVPCWLASLPAGAETTFRAASPASLPRRIMRAGVGGNCHQCGEEVRDGHGLTLDGRIWHLHCVHDHLTSAQSRTAPEHDVPTPPRPEAPIDVFQWVRTGLTARCARCDAEISSDTARFCENGRGNVRRFHVGCLAREVATGTSRVVFSPLRSGETHLRSGSGTCRHCDTDVALGVEVVEDRTVYHPECFASRVGAIGASAPTSLPSPFTRAPITVMRRGGSWDDAPMEGETITLDGVTLRVTAVEGVNLRPDVPLHLEADDHWEFRISGEAT